MAGNNSRGLVLQERDRQLLRELAVMRVIDREQAKTVAGFCSTTRANARLLALTRAGMLRRFFLATKGAGQKGLYSLSQKAAVLFDVPYRGLRRREDETLVADVFVTHQLAINDIYCQLKYQPIPIPKIMFKRWLAFYETLTANHRLIPDGYFELMDPSGVTPVFLEVDLGNESLRVWKEKVRAYLQFALSGDFQRRFGQSRFRVLVVANTERRLESIRGPVRAATEKVFWFTTLEAINRDGLWSPIWLRPVGDEQLPLL